MTTAYIDASALVKLVLDEPDGIAMRHWYHEHERVASSRIGIIESRRAVRRKVDDPAHGDPPRERAGPGQRGRCVRDV